MLEHVVEEMGHGGLPIGTGDANPGMFFEGLPGQSHLSLHRNSPGS